MFVSSHFKNLNHWYTVGEFDFSTTMFTYHVISGPRFLEKDNPVIGGLRGLYYQIIIYYLFFWEIWASCSTSRGPGIGTKVLCFLCLLTLIAVGWGFIVMLLLLCCQNKFYTKTIHWNHKKSFFLGASLIVRFGLT